MTTLEKIYPGHKIVGANQIFLPRIGWRDVCTTTREEAGSYRCGYIENGSDRHENGMVALILEDENGFHRIADFRPNEF